MEIVFVRPKYTCETVLQAILYPELEKQLVLAEDLRCKAEKIEASLEWKRWVEIAETDRETDTESDSETDPETDSEYLFS